MKMTTPPPQKTTSAATPSTTPTGTIKTTVRFPVLHSRRFHETIQSAKNDIAECGGGSTGQSDPETESSGTSSSCECGPPRGVHHAETRRRVRRHDGLTCPFRRANKAQRRLQVSLTRFTSDLVEGKCLIGLTVPLPNRSSIHAPV
jgi:hypothetical protein